jgi:two-component system CheB/CheR fusion protein
MKKSFSRKKPTVSPLLVTRTNRASTITSKTVSKNSTPDLKTFPIVGVGASAGGLDAFTQLLKHLPADTGMGFVLVQHLDPVHASALSQLLGRTTTMPVQEATNKLRVRPNHVYVIPPNAMMEITRGVLQLTPRNRQARGAILSIDSFLASLALDRRARAIGIVLSGTASDGTRGLAAIKAAGGVTFAQDESAKYDSMPRSAIAAGCVDFVLSPEAIALELARIARHPFVLNRPRYTETEIPAEAVPATAPAHGRPAHLTEAGPQAEITGEPDEFQEILLSLRAHCGVDFSHYKSSTIRRRIARRMVLNRHQAHGDYAAFLKGNVKELSALYSDVLINVTSFFRNPSAFETLKRKIFPTLLAGRGRDEPLRVWTLGCSTGQEAYSLAMAYAEVSAKILGAPQLQIFATDLNDAHLEKARLGLYPKSLAREISAARLRRFFGEEAGGYRIGKALREQVVFARQNVLSDPPFSRIDLISCRNLLIYLEAGLQKKIMPAFHYALKPGGFLFLGASESVGPCTELFVPVDKKHKIFSKKVAPTSSFRLTLPAARAPQPTLGPRPFTTVERAPGLPESLRLELDAQREADRLSVSQFAPPGVLINAQFQVVQFRGVTGAYLEPPVGQASFDVLKMARDGLMLPLRAAIKQAQRDLSPVRHENVRLRVAGATRTVHLQVIPLKNLKELCYLILFEAPGPGSPDARPVAASAPPKAEIRRVTELERELAETRDYLQSVQEQHEAAREELQASNEEVQSANEELQSINEELETSKEELESTNEELTTLNEEMLSRHAELNRLGGDLNNLFVNINTAVLVVGRDLDIRRFTPLALKIFNLLPTDAGRPLGGVRHNLDCPDLEELIAEVIATASAREREVQDKDGRWHALRARPYMTLDKKVDGAVLVLTEIDALKRGEEAIRAARDYAEATLRAARDPLLVLHADLRVKTANDAFYKFFHTLPERTEGLRLEALGSGEWKHPGLRKKLLEVVSANRPFNDFELAHDFPGVGRIALLLNARPLPNDTGENLVLLCIADSTARLASVAAMARSEVRYRRLFEAAHDGILILDPATRKITDANPYILKFLGYERDELLGLELWEIGLLKDQAASKAAFLELRRHGIIRYDDLHLVTKSGLKKEVEFASNLYDEDGIAVIQCNLRDITERKEGAQALRKSEQRARRILESITDSFYVVDADWRITDMNSAARKTYVAQGMDPDLLIGKNFWSEAFTDMRGTQLEVEYRHVMSRRLSAEFEYFYEAWQCWFSIRAYPIESGGITVYFQDITARKRSEVAMSSALENLKVAQSAAARSSRAKNDFLAALSHELRTPLAPVLMTAAALREDHRLPPDVREQLAMMERNIGLEARLIDDLLDLTKITHDKLKLRAQPCDAHYLIGLAVEIVQEDAWSKDIVIEVALDAQRTALRADPARIQQVLWNLLRNAVKFTPRGGHVTLRTRDVAGRGGEPWVHIEVIDSGIGIDAARLEQIFLPFDQGGLTGDHRFGGVGLGLSIARAVLDLHGGKISAQSGGPNRGATFTVELPCAVLPAGGDAVTGSLVTAGDESALQLPLKAIAPLRLLLVEDHPSTLKALTGFLRDEGYEVVPTATMSEALYAAETKKFDLVISDLGLPDGMGIDLMTKLRRAYGLRGIALSGYGMEEDLALSVEAGFVTHLVKPVSIAELRRAITALPHAEK